MIYLVDFIYSFSLYVSIYIFLFLILASRILFRVSSCVYECVQCEFVHVYRKSKHPYWKKKIYSVLTCSSWFFLHPPSLLPCFFQYYVNGWWFHMKERVCFFLEKEKNKSFFSCRQVEYMKGLWLMLTHLSIASD